MIWGQALRTVLRDFLDQPLQWGVYDCCCFASAYVKARTGVDHVAAFRYDSKISALKILSDHKGIQSLVESRLGPAKTESSPGDLVLCHVEELLTLGVSNGSFVWSFVHDRGLVRIPLAAVICAWGV